MRLSDVSKLGGMFLLFALVGCAEEEGTTREYIGPKGGTVVSSDGKLRLEVPAGVFAKDTEVVIEELDGKAPSGIGPGYRLRPQGVLSDVPVRLVFDKGEESEVAVGVASTESHDGWMVHLDAVFDRDNATLTVETNQFTDWSLVQMFRVEPSEAKVRRGDTLLFDVRICLEDSETLFDGATRAPVLATCTPWDLSDRVVGWEVNGVDGGHERFGSVSGTGSRATYTPPEVVPDPAVVWVTARLDIPGRPEGGLGSPVTIE